MTRVFSGIQPTGHKHLGNYIGAIRHYVIDQSLGEAFYCIVDLHSISVDHDPATLAENTNMPLLNKLRVLGVIINDSGIVVCSTVTPIIRGSVHVAMSYGRKISLPGCRRTSG